MSDEEQNQPQKEQKIIDERTYNYQAPRPKGPHAIGKGGDAFFRNIHAPQDMIKELMEETETVQNWVQRETSNSVALSCLNNENLKDIYFEIKDGFGDYGPIMLMGFKTPQGVEIPRLKILDGNGDVVEVLTGPLAIDELNKRALAYKESSKGYESLDNVPFENEEKIISENIDEYSGNSNK